MVLGRTGENKAARSSQIRRHSPKYGVNSTSVGLSTSGLDVGHGFSNPNTMGFHLSLTPHPTDTSVDFLESERPGLLQFPFPNTLFQALSPAYCLHIMVFM